MTFEEALEKEGRIIHTNRGVSMRPFVKEGRDVMVIEPLKEKPKKYDAVMFRRENASGGKTAYVLHRVMKVLPGDVFYIIGDNTVSGEYVKLENILGIMTYIQSEDREIDCANDARYQRLVRAWWLVYPIRKCLLRARGFLGKCKRRFVGRA
ncbi:MAG: S24/S26 family peptidase [Lachnospiraceae bacterium]|nr:S24/S26 family peptidase [Lachnospiraceae bacterium]